MSRIASLRDVTRGPVRQFPVMVLILTLCGLNSSKAFNPEDTSQTGSDYQPALGINEVFSRWDGVISLVYDPDGAPGFFSDDNHVLQLVQQALAQWEMVCGIRFQIVGVDSNIPDDSNAAPENQDGLIRIFWGTAGGAAGRARPLFGTYNEDAGYLSYYDGSVELNADPGIWDSDDKLVNTLVHELGHLIGLGHSDNPESVMFSGPYNHLLHPRQDDILAVQTLYGPPAIPINAAEPQAVWLYQPPPAASADMTQYLFKANQYTDEVFTWAYALGESGEQNTASIDDSTPDAKSLGIKLGGLGNFDNTRDINIETTLIVVDPEGYVYATTDLTLDCQAGYACGGGWWSFSTTDILKTVPGVWNAYVVDATTDPDNPVTLIQAPLTVDTTVEINKPPLASLAVTPGSDPAVVDFSVISEDPENGEISVIWHPPGPPYDLDHDFIYDHGITDNAGSGEEVNRTITFPATGAYTLFVEIRDDGARYQGTSPSNSAGEGYQTLLRIDLTLPIRSDNDVHVTSNIVSDGYNRNEVLSAIAESNALSGIITHTGAKSAAKIYAAASSNGGVTVSDVFSVDDNVVLAGEVRPRAEDLGKQAEILVLINDGDNKWSYRDLDGNFQAWNGKVSGLGAAYEIGSLSAAESFEIYSGTLGEGNQRIFVGYMLTEGGPIHFNSKALKLDVL